MENTFSKEIFRNCRNNHRKREFRGFNKTNSIDELKVELKKDVDHGDLAPGKVNRICDELEEII